MDLPFDIDVDLRGLSPGAAALGPRTDGAPELPAAARPELPAEGVHVELDTPPPVGAQPGEPLLPTGTLAGRVLVVDDEAVVRDVVARILAREPDLAVTAVPDAEHALGLCAPTATTCW